MILVHNAKNRPIRAAKTGVSLFILTGGLFFLMNSTLTVMKKRVYRVSRPVGGSALI